jgi:hypothetical protein
MKKIIIFSIIIILGLGSLRFFSIEDSWVCDNGIWIKHGNPATFMPKSGCEDGGSSNASVNFSENGHFVKDNPGLKPGIWYFIYEKPGQPALYKELIFDQNSFCKFGSKEGQCPDVLLPASSLTKIEGVEKEGRVLVLSATTGN